jgi:hypothetical protein
MAVDGTSRIPKLAAKRNAFSTHGAPSRGRTTGASHGPRDGRSTTMAAPVMPIAASSRP